ncbi:MAG: hypothetical protein U0Q55_07730 [Vicinamibacterales bacterium]
MSAVIDPTDTASPEGLLEERRLRRLERSRDSRPLDAWERYRALVDVVDDYREQLDSSDKKTRFALIIMGLLNAVNFLLIARSDVFGAAAHNSGRWLAAYSALYAFVSLYFFSQAIDALRPREPRLHREAAAAAAGSSPRRLRSMAHVALQGPDEHYDLWTQAQVGQLSKEVAYQAQALARINVEKYRALARVYNGLIGLTGLTAILVTALAFRGLTS